MRIKAEAAAETNLQGPTYRGANFFKKIKIRLLESELSETFDQSKCLEDSQHQVNYDALSTPPHTMPTPPPSQPVSDTQ